LDDVAAIFDTVLLQSLMQIPATAKNEDELIHGLHTALLDSDATSVAEIAERLQMNGMQLERLSKRVFGFPPKLLIRRQRFLRTLALLMRQPQAKWGEILDPQYYDQAHFNRDFQRFFAMSPKEYLALDKPIVSVAAMARMKALGDPLQGLHAPRGEE
jgi:methylphosphotriester-DNA--protein-cysteine methyltransferase